MSNKINELIVFLVVFISRLPFIWNSPGIDPDNWLVLRIGKEISDSGSYKASRLPGYPISEYLASFFGGSAWWVLNMVTVFFTAFCCVVFYKILEHYNVKTKTLIAISLGFVQSIFISSTTNMDYNWSLFFLLLGLFSLLKRKLLIAGFAIGLMIGIRFTNIIFLFPILYFLHYNVKIRSLKSIVQFYAVALLAFGLVFIPVFNKYSLNIFPDVGNDSIDVKSIVSQATLYVYGVLGLLGLLVAVIYLLFFKTESFKKLNQNKEIVVFSGLMIMITSLLYIKYPFESYYNIPSVPFVLLILAMLIHHQKVKVFVLMCFIGSPFFIYVSSNKIQLKGAIFVNEKMEDDYSNYVQSVHATFSNIKTEKRVLITAGFYNCYIYKYQNKNKNVKILGIPTLELLKYYISKGYKVYYPKGIEKEVEIFNNYNISEYGEGILEPLNFDR